VTRIAVDGIDCAGKTTLADALARLIQATRVSVDDYLRPVEDRYRRGAESPEGYFLDSFDYARFREAVLGVEGAVVADGVFLQRPELDDLWTVRIWIEIGFEQALERAVVRDAGKMTDVRGRYERRYWPGQQLYIEAVDPRSRADIVVDGARA
jgi:uridine kinase